MSIPRVSSIFGSISKIWPSKLIRVSPQLKTGLFYRWLRHPMYVGVLIGIWATPRMMIGHALRASGLTLYVLIAMRYEERDLIQRFGTSYARWRSRSGNVGLSGARPSLPFRSAPLHPLFPVLGERAICAMTRLLYRPQPALRRWLYSRTR